MMQLNDLEVALEPLMKTACDSDDENVLKVGVVLAALCGCIVEPIGAQERRALDSLARLAGAICEHGAGLHNA